LALRFFIGGLTVCVMGAQAQGLVEDPDWKETDAPPPPTFNTNTLVPIVMPPYVTLKFGVDPDTLTITPDGIVRYVMVATNASGSVNAMYEGIRCATDQVKTYARHNSSAGWTVIKEPQWRNVTDNLPSKHAMAFARQGACDNRTTTASTVGDIIKSLKK
jgi:hypothetical protein